MDHDDQQIGRILSRREVLALFGTAGAAILVGCGPTSSAANTPAAATSAAAPTTATEAAVPTSAPVATVVEVAPTTAAPTTASVVAVPACIVRPEVTEGPYYVDEDLNRSDIRADPSTGTVSEGIPLVLTFNIAQIAGSACTALAGAKVEIWHCDAAGVYSDVTDRGFSTVGRKFLRGSQMTDAMVSRLLPQSILAGIRAAPSISISRFVQRPAWNLPRNCSLMTHSQIRCLPRLHMRPKANEQHAIATMASTKTNC